MTARVLTVARLEALKVAAAHPAGVKYSNVTDGAKGTVYWQSAQYLVEHDLLTVAMDDGRGLLVITAAGQEALALHLELTGRARERTR